MTDVSQFVLAIAVIWVPVVASIMLVVWSIRKDGRESKVTGLLQSSEERTKPLAPPPPVAALASMLDNLISDIGREVSRITMLLPTRSHLRVISGPHMRYTAWLKTAVASDLEALRTLRNAESVALGNPPPDAIPFLNATIASSERNLTALRILGDWLDRA